jgi:hypothetical protein
VAGFEADESPMRGSALATTAGLTRRDLPAYLRDRLRQAADLADEKLIVRYFSAAGLKLKIRFSDPDLADLYTARLTGRSLAAFAHTDLRIDVLEAGPLGWPPPASWDDPSCSVHHFDRELRAAGLRAAYPFEAGLWQVYDGENHAALQFAGAVGDLPVWDPGAPLRLLIHWALQHRGARLLHGAVLGNERDGIMIAGPGGIGKSGTTLAGILNGLRTVGDDYVAVQPGNPSIAWPVYRFFKQDAAGIARFPGLDQRIGAARANWQGKLEFDSETLAPDCIAESLRLRAVVVPAIGRLAASRVEPMPRGEAIEAIARSTIFQLDGEPIAATLFCTGLTARLPTFRLRLSEDPAEIAATIGTLLQDLAG